MKQVPFGTSGEMVSAISIGCMRITNLSADQTVAFLNYALEHGVNFFDHADIYGSGACEERFGAGVKQAGIPRDSIFVQSKCGIARGGMFDFSKEHIIEAVEGSLKRLNMDYLDSLLLHRPDALVEPEEVAEAFDTLKQQGKVRYFGVSNHTPMQMELLKKWVKQPLMANQLQFSIAHASMISSGLEANMGTAGAINRDGSVLDYCRLNDVTIQAWSPFLYGFFEGVFLGSEKYPELNQKLQEIAKVYGVSDTTIATAWLLRHPANVQVITGTMKQTRLDEICKACDIVLTRKEWYDIYKSAGNIIP